MKLTPITADFKHDGQQYYAGEVRMLSPELHGYFSVAGWTGDKPAAWPKSQPVTLEVQSGKHNLNSPSVRSK
jgi:hypothetical protein